MSLSGAARLLGALLVLALLPVAPGQGLRDLQQSLEDARRLEQQQTARAAQLQSELGQLGAQESRLTRELAQLGDRLDRLEGERGEVRRRIIETQDRLAAIERDIARLETTIERQKLEVQALIVQLGRERGQRYVRLLARAESIYDVIIKARYLNEIAGQDLGVIQELQANVLALEATRTAQIDLIASLNDFQRQLVAKTDEVQAGRRAANASLAELRRTQQGRQAVLLQTVQARQRTSTQVGDLVAQVVAERARLAEEARLAREREAERRREEQRRIARERDQQERARLAREEQSRAERANANLPAMPILPAAVGRLSFPVPAGVILQDYGAFGQNFQVIRGPQAGAAVVAAAGGVVMVATFIQANTGYTVAIQHTPTVYTVYSNLQDPAVTTGASVSRGQLVGWVGGGTLIEPDVLQFQVGVVTASNELLYVDPRRYY